jgi:hypothetical protein
MIMGAVAFAADDRKRFSPQDSILQRDQQRRHDKKCHRQRGGEAVSRRIAKIEGLVDFVSEDKYAGRQAKYHRQFEGLHAAHEGEQAGA